MKIRYLLFLLLSASPLSGLYAQCSVTSTPGSYCGSGDAIDAFTLAGVTTPGNYGCTNGSGYTFFPNVARTLAPGKSYSWSATTGGSVFPQGFALWIDLNGNNQFESSEQLIASNYGYSHSGTITIPTTATGSKVRMRTMCSYYTVPSAGSACSNPSYFGETEDYWVTLCEAASFLSQPSASVYGCEGGSTSLEVDANAGYYQWQVDLGTGFTDISNGSTYSGATTKKLILTNIPSTLNNARFRCLIAPSCSQSLTRSSDTVVLPVYPNVKIEAQSLVDTSCVGVNTKLYIKPEGTVVGHKWQIFDKTINDYVDVPSNPFVLNGDTLTVQNTPDTLNGALIRAIVIGQCGIDTSKPMQMVVHALPAVVTDPKDLTLDQGQDATFKIVAAGVGVKYQWQVGYKDTFSNINNGGIYDGVHGDILTVKGVSRPQNEFQFRAIVKGVGSCALSPDTSNFAVLYVNPAVSVGNLEMDKNITVYPNPVAGTELVVNVAETDKNISDYKVIDKTGKLVMEGTLNASGTTKINVGKLAADVYTIQILNNESLPVKSIRFTKL